MQKIQITTLPLLPGKIRRFLPPLLPGLRIDSGFEWGSRIPGDFDSMVAKIIAKGANRKSHRVS